MRGRSPGSSSFRVTPCVLGLGLQELHDVSQHFSQGQGDLLQLAVAGLHLGHVQQIVDQVQQTLDLVMGPA